MNKNGDMRKMIELYIDDREGERGGRAWDYFTDLKYPVNVQKLATGDYVFYDTESKLTVAFEYKTMEDYLSSISDNRVFNQALNQSNTFSYHFVIIEGDSETRKQLIRETERYSGKYVTNKQFYGSIGTLVNITSVLQADNEKHCFLLMETTSRHCLDLKPVLKRFHKSRGSPALRLLHNNINGIGYVKAKKICEECGLETISDVFELNTEKLTKIEGIGTVTAENILKQLKNEFS